MRLAFNANEKGTDRRGKRNETGIYKPPRISATAMPSTENRQKSERKTGRSRTLDEYVSTELSSAPMAEPSVGSNLAAGGRQSKNARQLKEEAERRSQEAGRRFREQEQAAKERLRSEREAKAENARRRKAKQDEAERRSQEAAQKAWEE